MNRTYAINVLEKELAILEQKKLENLSSLQYRLIDSRIISIDRLLNHIEIEFMERGDIC